VEAEALVDTLAETSIRKSRDTWRHTEVEATKLVDTWSETVESGKIRTVDDTLGQ